MLQDIEKMKVQYLMSLSFDLFEILQAVKCITHFSSKLDPTCSSNQTVLFQITFQHHFCLNNRPFVFSIIDNNFDSGCHSNKI